MRAEPHDGLADPVHPRSLTASWSATPPPATGDSVRGWWTSRARQARRWCCVTCTRSSNASPCRRGRPRRSRWCARRAGLRRRGGPGRHRLDELVRASGEPARDLDGEGAGGLVDRGGAGTPDASTPAATHRHTATTITDHARLRTDLDLTRERGYATCRGEFDASAWGVSAPVLDRMGRPLAVLSLWDPPPRVAADRFPTLGAIAVEAAERMAPR